ncbi:RNA methyltransferase tRNA(m5U54)methyltransferase [Aspergillus hancockii]|nr:RNA methyltransferase tRNA(m5U54)methyltransferase [Aspergillus hancockii]
MAFRDCISQETNDVDTHSMVSMQRLDASPVQEAFPDRESGLYIPREQDPKPGSKSHGGLSTPKLGLSGYSWTSWLSTIQKYSSYPPTLFFALHVANTSLFPLATRSVPDSEPYLLLTRPIYQSPGLEHVILTIPILIHVASGIVLRNIRSYRRARLYGAETRSQRHLLNFWPRVSLQARLGSPLFELMSLSLSGPSRIATFRITFDYVRSNVPIYSHGLSPVRQLVQYAGKEYHVVKEGKAFILNPPSQAAASKGTRRDLKAEDEAQSVFYNPIQQFNRDLSVLAIKTYGEHVLALKKQRAERVKRRDTADGNAKGKKRKRDVDDEKEEHNGKGIHSDSQAQIGDQLCIGTLPEQKNTPSFTILDALSATGLRALRYASEIPSTTCIVANDLSPSAIQSMKVNIEYNGLTKLIQTNTGDARTYMYNTLNPTSTQSSGQCTGKFDVIDLDPYGSAAPFLDSAVQAVKDGGLLCVTCTDAGVWASNGYPEKSFALYGGVPTKGTHSHEGGPMWAGPLHNPHFIQRILDTLPEADRGVYQTVDRIEGMLTTALEEDLSPRTSSRSASPEPASSEAKAVASNETPAIIPRMDPALREPYPFYFSLSALSKVLHTSTISADAFRGAVRHLGYQCTRSHTKPNTIRTDAPWDVIWEIMREWVRQKSPIKENALKPGTAGAVIMAKSRENIPTLMEGDQQLDLLKKEIVSATENGINVSDVVTKVEAALYRSSSRQALGQSAADSRRADLQKDLLNPGQIHATSTTKPHLGALDVVFDESLGRELTKKRLVRYQLNPRANWGPLNRASGRG